MENIIKARLIIRNGTSEEWNEKNPVLSAGEPGVTSDGKVLKIGDGKTPWNELTQISGDLMIATQEKVGGVLSSLDNNKIKVEEDGTMSLNKVSTSLLYVPQDDELILDGGKS